MLISAAVPPVPLTPLRSIFEIRLVPTNSTILGGLRG